MFTGLTAIPDDPVVPRGSVIALTVAAGDETGDPLTFTWSAGAGLLSASTGDSVSWTAPEALGSCTIAVTCTDGRHVVDTAYVAGVRAWHGVSSDVGMSPDSLLVPRVGTAVETFDLTDDIPPGSLLDSAKVTALFRPDTLDGSRAEVWVTSPSGTEVKVWDRRTGHIEIDEVALGALTGETPRGVWRLTVTRDDPTGPDGWLDEFGLSLDYRY